jgi:hypothetical protein
MTDSIKILAQLLPSANVLTDFYTVPALTATAASSIIICNQNAVSSIIFRISLAVAGAADNGKQYVYYDIPLLNNDTFIATIGLTLSAGDVIRVRTDSTNVSFQLFGVEVS